MIMTRANLSGSSIVFTKFSRKDTYDRNISTKEIRRVRNITAKV